MFSKPISGISKIVFNKKNTGFLKYKLTTQNNTTHNNTNWGENITHETNGEGGLCGPGWLHYYHTPELAVLLNIIHANIDDPKLWECFAEGVHKDDCGLKGGCTRLTTLREVELPNITITQRVEFGIRCAMEVHKENTFTVWANNWLNGIDRSRDSADSTYAVYAFAFASASASHHATYAACYAAARASAYASAAARHDNASYAACHAAARAGLTPERLTEIAKQVVSS